MKKLILLVFLLSSFSYSQEEVLSKDINEIIDNQVGLTGDFIKKFIDDMNAVGPTGSLENADYVNFVKDSTVKIEKALNQFRGTLQNIILPDLSRSISELKRLEGLKDDYDLKLWVDLRGNVVKQLRIKAANASAAFHLEVKKLYTLIIPTIPKDLGNRQNYPADLKYQLDKFCYTHTCYVFVIDFMKKYIEKIKREIDRSFTIYRLESTLFNGPEVIEIKGSAILKDFYFSDYYNTSTLGFDEEKAFEINEETIAAIENEKKELNQKRSLLFSQLVRIVGEEDFKCTDDIKNIMSLYVNFHSKVDPNGIYAPRSFSSVPKFTSEDISKVIDLATKDKPYTKRYLKKSKGYRVYSRERTKLYDCLENQAKNVKKEVHTNSAQISSGYYCQLSKFDHCNDGRYSIALVGPMSKAAAVEECQERAESTGNKYCRVYQK